MYHWGKRITSDSKQDIHKYKVLSTCTLLRFLTMSPMRSSREAGDVHVERNPGEEG